MSKFLIFDESKSSLFTVHVPHLPLYQAEGLVNQYSGSWMTEEKGGDSYAVG